MTGSNTNGRMARNLMAGVSFAAMLVSAPALAQEEQSAETKAGTSQVEQIVVTGSRNPMKVLETSYGITVLDQGTIAATNPVGLTDLASSIPGLQGEYANGEANSNLNVRGTQAGFIAFISLQEDGLPAVYSPFLAEMEFRNDLSYNRVEAVLGGPSGIFTAQGAAATLNFLSRLPTTSEGQARLSITDYGEYRGELFVGGPIGGDGWFGAVGGYFRQGNGVHDLGFTADSGGQVRANIRKEWSNGKLSFAYKKINDRTNYVNPLPVDVSGKYPVALPGFNARDDSIVGPDLRYVNAIRPGGIEQRDIADGQFIQSDQFTVAAEYEASDRVTITNKTRYSHVRSHSLDLRGFANASLVKGDAFLASQLPVLQAAFPTATSVRLVRAVDGSVVANPATMNGNGLITTSDSIDYMRNNRTFINTFEVNYAGDRVNLTGGVQFWDVRTKSGMVSDRILHDIKHHANRLDVQALDAAGNVVGSLAKDGVITVSDVNNFGGLDTTSINPYLNLEFEVTDNLRIDAGVRYEHSSIRAHGEDVSLGVPITGPHYDASSLSTRTYAVLRNGNIVTGRTTMEGVSWTVGANLQLSDNLAVYGRYASAADNGYNNEFSFFSIPGFGTPASARLGLTNKETRLNFGELGVRYLGQVVSGSVTAFYTLHENSGVIFALANGANGIVPVDTEAKGAEFWIDVRPSDMFKVSFSGVIMDSNKTGSGFNNVPSYRLPEVQLRVAPTLSLGDLSIGLVGQYYGERFADQSATRVLPSYLDLSANVTYAVTDAIKFSLQGRNLTNELAFTSGNFREGFTQGPNPFGYASPIPGRVFRLIADVSF